MRDRNLVSCFSDRNLKGTSILLKETIEWAK